jgi:ankyrin repeat protein
MSSCQPQRGVKNIPEELWQEHILPQILGSRADLPAWRHASRFCHGVSNHTPLLDQLRIRHDKALLPFLKTLLDGVLEPVQSAEETLPHLVTERLVQFAQALSAEQVPELVIYLWRTKNIVPLPLFRRIIAVPAVQEMLKQDRHAFVTRFWGILGNPHKVVLFQYLLDDGCYTPSSSFFQSACRHGHTAIAERLLGEEYYDCIDPSEDWNEALWTTCAQGNAAIVRLLLQHPNLEDPNHYHDYQVHHDITMDGDPDEEWHEHSSFDETCKNGHVETLRLLLDDARINPTGNDQWCCGIQLAAERGNLSVVKMLIEDGRHPPDSFVKALAAACKKGQLPVVRCILDDYDVDPSDQKNIAFLMACKHGQLDIVVYLLKDKRVNPTAEGSAGFTSAIENGHMHVVRLLQDDARMGGVGDGIASEAFSKACAKGQVAMVRFLCDPNTGIVNPSANDNDAVIRASANGHSEVVKLLLEDERVDPAARDQEALCAACSISHDEYKSDDEAGDSDKNTGPDDCATQERHHKGATEIVRLLLQDYRVDPGVNENMPLGQACREGHTEIVKLLLAHDGVDPAGDGNYAVIAAAMSGHTEIVRLLLADPRVDPSDQNNNALLSPCQTGYTSVIRLLLADPRVDPTANNHECIANACEGGYPKTVRLLLDDGRADPMAQGNVLRCVTSYCPEAPAVLRMLLADPRVDLSRNDGEDGYKALQLAKKERGPEMVRLLLDSPFGLSLPERTRKEYLRYE